jgi:hypothetical protein
MLLGMRAESHGDSQIEAHLRIHILTNLPPQKGVAAHLDLFQDQVEAGGHFGGHFRTGGFEAAKGSQRRTSSRRRPQDDEEAVPGVYPVDDVAGWTRVASSFVRHGYICKSQRTVMTHDCTVTDHGR